MKRAGLVFVDASRIRRRRIALGLTQEQVGRQLKSVSYQPGRVVCTIEAGKMGRTWETLAELAIALGTTPDYLLGFKDTP